MIPIRDLNPTTKPAVIVPILIGINAVAFLFVQPTFAKGPETIRRTQQERFFSCHAAVPYEIMHGETALDGAVRGTIRASRVAAYEAGLLGRQPCEDKNIWLSILYSMFLHGGWAHIIGNMLFLWVFGNNVEDRLGKTRFVLFYLIAGIAATYAQALINPSSAVPLIGASGAIAGVLGAYMLMFPHARVVTLIIFVFITTIEMPAIVLLGIWFVLQFFQGVGSVTGDVGGVAYMAHVGGFVAGMLLLFVFRPRAQPERPVSYG